MLEISGGDIANLGDEDLRGLVGMLCEAELRAHALSASAATWGGSQTARDGGIDVRVAMRDGAAPGGFLPRADIGFQVKRTDFTPSLIGPEMKPSGILRGSIKELIENRGAYIIVSSGADTSDSALKDRLNAMRDAVADLPNHPQIHLDFYDRKRLETWVRNHPGLAVWVRQRTGRSIAGWQPYSSWALSPDGVNDEYILDDKSRLYTGMTDDKGIDVTNGIQRIRDIVRQPRGVVRLTGLSGVGKTRLVQALFDTRIGSNALDPASAVYTDMNDNPSPQPTGMISDLIASRTRTIIVIDNCAPDLHRRVTEVCRGLDSLIGVITVEYDVQDDEPEGTKAFRLEPSSVDLIAKLIARRFPSMTRLDVDKIAEFSGGNSRVALALANTLERHESVAELEDEELFKRLFHQRQDRDDGLLKAGKACALLYSFQGEALSGEAAELPQLAALAGTNAQDLFGKVAQLKQRDLVQKRSVWRAILPHAVANRLAKMALREIPSETIEAQFNTERMMKSFSRRLGFLHESPEAQRIVERWLQKDGYLSNIANLNQFGQALLENVAPVLPEAALAAIERELVGPNGESLIEDRPRRDKIGYLLRSIAYDAQLFERCVDALIVLTLSEPAGDRMHPMRGALEGLFHLVLSGTHATIEQRTAVVGNLLRSSEVKRRALGIELLDELLKSGHFSATHSFEFGARARDYGFWPKTKNEQDHWFIEALSLARQFVNDNELRASVRSKIAHALHGLWFLGPSIQELFEGIAAEIGEQDYWEEGWLAARSLLSRPLKNADDTAMQWLRTFERSLRPKTVVDQIRAVVLTQSWGALDYADLDEETEEQPTRSYEKANLAAEELGKKIAGDDAGFDRLLPELLKGNAGRLVPFGKGLGLAAKNHRAVWKKLTDAFEATQGAARNAGTLAGFLVGLNQVQHSLCETLLDEALTHPTLAGWFPILQANVPITAAGAKRLKRSAEFGLAKAGVFRFLGYSRACDALSGADLRDIVSAVAKLEHGYLSAVDILSMLFHSAKDDATILPDELIQAGRTLLAEPSFDDRDNMLDHHLSTIAARCFDGAEGEATARSLCIQIKARLAEYKFQAYSFEQLLRSLFRSHPLVVLDEFFSTGATASVDDFDVDDFYSPSDRRKNPLDQIPDNILIDWCDQRPSERYERMARAVSYYRAGNEARVEWTPPALTMLKQAPDPSVVLATFVERFEPRSWSGSRAAIIESRLPLLDQLEELGNPAIDSFIEKKRPEIVEIIRRTREWEDKQDSDRDERFE